jgi:anti-anti-sigma factor
MSKSKIYYAQQEGIHGLKFVGDIRYTFSASLDKFLKKLYAGPTPKWFMVDLRETDVIDSTSLGLLAHIANWMKNSGAPKVILVSTNEDINDLLMAIGFDQVFNIVDETGKLLMNGKELALSDSTREELTHIVLDAHRTLMEIKEENKARFKGVVELFERSLERSTSGTG